ncbi:MAG: phospholipase C, phosphocholine-specific [Chitinophagaceae bacterium]
MNKQTRRNFLKNAGLLSGGVGIANALPASIKKAFRINPDKGSTFEDAQHIVLLMQENRSFDHCFGTLNGVRGFNDPRAIQLPNGNPVWLQTNKAGKTYLPFRLNMDKSKITWMGGLPHSWTDQVDARNNGKYDNWLNAKPAGYPGFRDMPMTMGHYTREDLPFNYALADAFTICDHHFCSSLTGTTPNRLYYFTGALRRNGNPDEPALVQNEYVDYDREVNWYTVPEMLQDAGLSWRIYQNELSYPSGLSGDDEPWLANFTDNPIEWFSQFHIRHQERYVGSLQNMLSKNNQHITELQSQLESNAEDKNAAKELKTAQGYKKWLEKELPKVKAELATTLDVRSKALRDNAFTINDNDSDFHKTEKIKYNDGTEERETTVPKSDILLKFRQDVQSGNLPAVSWLVAPENFSDHPAAPWYGSWYVSEVLDILTQNPEVWKKTIFILTYDENDGYYDHLPPFVAPDYRDESTGKVSSSIQQLASEYVTREDEEVRKKVSPIRVRESAIGLGYRVPFIVASPWTRGGYVNSQVFDHTSVVQFLEDFVSRKTKKKVVCQNLTDWRRAVCGNLRSVFRPYNGEKMDEPTYLERNAYVQRIHKARYQPLPTVMEPLSDETIHTLKTDKTALQSYLQQEKGARKSNPLPYELSVDLHQEGNRLQLDFEAAKKLFKEKSAGAPFTVYALNDYKTKDQYALGANWNFTVAPGDSLQYDWSLDNFADRQYQLAVHGPNGFYRLFEGNGNNPKLDIVVKDIVRKSNKYGALRMSVYNKESKTIHLIIKDNAYGKSVLNKTIAANTIVDIDILLENSFGWYDFTVTVGGYNDFKAIYAGHAENGKEAMSDPQIEK